MKDAVKALVTYFEESEIKNAYEVALKMLMVAVEMTNAEALHGKFLLLLKYYLKFV